MIATETKATTTTTAAATRAKRSEAAKKAWAHRKKIQRYMDNNRREIKELEGMTGQQIEDRAYDHMAMVTAPIMEAFRKGEISLEDAKKRVGHEAIKDLQESIKEVEYHIDMALHWGRPQSTDPEVIERVRGWMEKQRREDPKIIKWQALIDGWKQDIVEIEREFLGGGQER